MDKRQRIVIIDDNANDLQVTRRFLERRGFDSITALSGEEGIELARKSLPDAIIVDYRMPGMDGFEVTRQLKADPATQTIPVLMLTGSDSAQHVVEGLGAGAEDFVTKGSDAEVIHARLRALLRVKSYQDQLRRINAVMTRDLHMARRVQEALVPNREFSSAKLDIRSAYIPSEVLSGDFYDYFVQDESLFLFVADVSGHGLPSAILVSMLKSYIHTEATVKTSLADFMAALNNFLFSVSLPTQFATAQLFRVNGDRRIVYANAAHPPFILCRAKGETSVHEIPSNLLGAMPNMQFEEHTLHVEPGDTLFVYTDGLTDRLNVQGEFYPIERVASLLEDSRGKDIAETFDAIFRDVSGFVTTEDFKDDIAFVVTRFH
jgi:serine phosphatase RsbU (regulator of sigma subunit)